MIARFLSLSIVIIESWINRGKKVLAKTVTDNETGEKVVSKKLEKLPPKQPPNKRGNRKARNPLQGVPIPVEQAKLALIKSRGVLAHAADMLGCDRTSLSNLVNRNPDLKAIREQERERLVDLVEEAYVQEAINGSEKHGAFILKTLGRHRGYDVAWKEQQINVLHQALHFITQRQSEE